MKAQKLKTAQDLTTEQKIREAAAKVFQQKGYAATRTRDIAEEAGLNLALINYYYRSKKNLFDIIMEDKLADFFKSFLPLLFEDDKSSEEKIKMIASNYIKLLLENPDLPIFVLNAIHADPQHFAKIVQGAEQIQYSPLEAQLRKLNPKAKFEHFFLNLMALCIFPFIMRPAISQISDTIAQNFESLMEERMALIPKWIDAMIKVK